MSGTDGRHESLKPLYACQCEGRYGLGEYPTRLGEYKGSHLDTEAPGW